MEFIGDALRQAFMPKQEYLSLRDEERAWLKLQRPSCIAVGCVISLAILVSTLISLTIVFPADPGNRPLCGGSRLQPLSINATKADTSDSDSFPGAFYLTDQETADYYYMVFFLPSSIIFLASGTYLVAGIVVAYSSPRKHGCLKVVENNFCASKRGGVRCLAILNGVFALIYALLAIFLGSSLLTLWSSCALPLFWCYEVASWGLVILFGATSYFLKRKASVIVDDGDIMRRNLGLEMLEANPLEITPEVEKRVNESFRTWVGSSLLSSDDEED